MFDSLPVPVLRELADKCVPQSYSKDQCICCAGEAAVSIWIIKEGMVRINYCGWSGENVTIEILTPGDAFGMASLGCKTYPGEVRAMKSVLVLAVSKNEMLDIINRHPVVAKGILFHLANRLSFLETLVLLAREPVKKRLIAALLYLSKKFGSVIPLTCAEIGAMAGTTPETTMRTFSDLKRMGYIQTSRGKVCVNDLSGLGTELDHSIRR